MSVTSYRGGRHYGRHRRRTAARASASHPRPIEARAGRGRRRRDADRCPSSQAASDSRRNRCRARSAPADRSRCIRAPRTARGISRRWSIVALRPDQHPVGCGWHEVHVGRKVVCQPRPIPTKPRSVVGLDPGGSSESSILAVSGSAHRQRSRTDSGRCPHPLLASCVLMFMADLCLLRGPAPARRYAQATDAPKCQPAPLRSHSLGQTKRTHRAARAGGAVESCSLPSTSAASAAPARPVRPSSCVHPRTVHFASRILNAPRPNLDHSLL